jgi:hypothetical protein
MNNLQQDLFNAVNQVYFDLMAAYLREVSIDNNENLGGGTK